MPVYQYAPSWSGGGIGVGATVMNMMTVDTTAKANAAAAAIRAWFEARKAALPDDVTITFPPEFRVLNLDGTLVGTVPVTPPANVVGTELGSWAGGTGRVVKWTTGVVLGGKRQVGHTYLVPSAGVYGIGGAILPATITSDTTAHGTLLAALNSNGTPLVVWSRVNEAMNPVLQGLTLAKVSRLKTRLDA